MVTATLLGSHEHHRSVDGPGLEIKHQEQNILGLEANPARPAYREPAPKKRSIPQVPQITPKKSAGSLLSAGAPGRAHVSVRLFSPLLRFGADVFILSLLPGLARGPAAARAALSPRAPKTGAGAGQKGRGGGRGGGRGSSRVWLAAGGCSPTPPAPCPPQALLGCSAPLQKWPAPSVSYGLGSPKWTELPILDTPIPGACSSEAHQHPALLRELFVALLRCSSLTAGVSKHLPQTSGGIWDQYLFLPPTAAGPLPARAAGHRWQRVSPQEGGDEVPVPRRGGARLLAGVGER